MYPKPIALFFRFHKLKVYENPSEAHFQNWG